MILEVFAAFWVAFGFGYLFNIKGKYLILAGFGGSIGWFAYKLSLYLYLSESLAFFISAIFFSVYCEIAARIYRTPSTLLSVCALIPLVPGYGIYKSIYAFMTSDYATALDYAQTTLFDAGALALGVILITTLFRGFRKTKNNKG